MALRDALDVGYREKAAATVAEKFMSLWQGYKSYALYCAIKSELSLYPLMRMLWDAGKKVLLPKVTDSGINLHYCGSMEELECGYRDIQEPTGCVAAGDVDLVAVPGAVFDRSGYRIGYGKGFYDRLLAGMSRKVTVGLAFEIQIVESVPHESHDVAVDVILTEKNVYAVKGIL